MNYAPLADLLPKKVFSELPSIAERFHICTPLRMAHFLAQTAHESGNFTRVEESFAYSRDRLLTVFKKYFNNQNIPMYLGKPIEIASCVYANRMGNGSEESCDGWIYRGRGYIQLTGRSNYKDFSQFIPEDVTLRPELVATKYPLLSAGWFFASVKQCNEIADQGADDLVVKQITRKINGGLNGLDDRLKLFDRYYGQIPH